MPTLYGPWIGNGRIEVDYSVKYNANRTACQFTAMFYLASRYSLSDTNNSWSLSNWGSASGGATSISHGGSGGRTAIYYRVGAWTDVPARPNFVVNGIEAYGGAVSASFEFPTGPLAPTVGYQASNIGSTSFTADITSVDANGGSLLDADVEYNTSATNVGATLKRAGSYKDIQVTGLQRNTKYYFRMRVRNSTYGWGPFNNWLSFTTATTVPGAPKPNWGIRDKTQISAYTTMLSVYDDGGLPLTNWEVQWNTTPSGGPAARSGSGTKDAQLVALTPGTLYHVHVRAANSKGWGPWSAWKTFETLPGVYVKHGGVWRNAIPYVKHNGVWRSSVRYIKHTGVWK